MNNRVRLKVVQVNQMESSGGAAKIALYLHHAMRQQGHEAWMCVQQKQSTDPSVLEFPDEIDFFLSPIIQYAYTRATQLKNRKWRKQFSRYLYQVRDPRRFLADELGLDNNYYPASRQLLNLLPVMPDIVHLHNLHHNYFDLRYLPKLTSQVPTIITLHDAWLLSGHCAHSLECERWKTGCGKCPHLDSYPEVKRDRTHLNWHRKRRIYTRSKLYVASPSGWMLDKIETSILKPAVLDARVIPNGVDQTIFNPFDRAGARTRLGISEETTVLLFVANGYTFNPYKDYTTITRAVDVIKQRNLNSEILLLLVGNTQPESSAAIGNSSNLQMRHVPFQHDLSSMADYYRAADIYLQASRADTFPNVVLEALACGTPVIATRVGGIPEQILDHQTGYLVEPGDWLSMAELTIKLIQDTDLRTRMGKQAAEDAKKRFQLDRMINSYIDWYYEILDKKAP